jgi:hypothetical protein
MMVLLRVVLLTLLAAPLAAQVDSTPRPAPAESSPVRIVTHNFTATSREFVRVKLEGGARYRATLSLPNIKLDIRTVNGTRELPVTPLEAESAYLISPPVTDEYEIRVLAEGDIEVTLTIDKVASSE